MQVGHGSMPMEGQCSTPINKWEKILLFKSVNSLFHHISLMESSACYSDAATGKTSVHALFPPRS